jgi:hypothetical protein
MNATIISKARAILAADEYLTDEQVVRCIQSAAADAENWAEEAEAEALPDIATMHHDWSIDTDLCDAGVNGGKMQRLSFNIATGRAGAKALEALAAF